MNNRFRSWANKQRITGRHVSLTDSSDDSRRSSIAGGRAGDTTRRTALDQIHREAMMNQRPVSRSRRPTNAENSGDDLVIPPLDDGYDRKDVEFNASLSDIKRGRGRLRGKTILPSQETAAGDESVEGPEELPIGDDSVFKRPFSPKKSGRKADAVPGENAALDGISAPSPSNSLRRSPRKSSSGKRIRSTEMADIMETVETERSRRSSRDRSRARSPVKRLTFEVPPDPELVEEEDQAGDAVEIAREDEPSSRKKSPLLVVSEKEISSDAEINEREESASPTKTRPEARKPASPVRDIEEERAVSSTASSASTTQDADGSTAASEIGSQSTQGRKRRRRKKKDWQIRKPVKKAPAQTDVQIPRRSSTDAENSSPMQNKNVRGPRNKTKKNDSSSGQKDDRVLRDTGETLRNTRSEEAEKLVGSNQSNKQPTRSPLRTRDVSPVEPFDLGLDSLVEDQEEDRDNRKRTSEAEHPAHPLPKKAKGSPVGDREEEDGSRRSPSEARSAALIAQKKAEKRGKAPVDDLEEEAANDRDEDADSREGSSEERFAPEVPPKKAKKGGKAPIDDEEEVEAPLEEEPIPLVAQKKAARGKRAPVDAGEEDEEDNRKRPSVEKPVARAASKKAKKGGKAPSEDDDAETHSEDEPAPQVAPKKAKKRGKPVGNEEEQRTDPAQQQPKQKPSKEPKSAVSSKQKRVKKAVEQQREALEESEEEEVEPPEEEPKSAVSSKQKRVKKAVEQQREALEESEEEEVEPPEEEPAQKPKRKPGPASKTGTQASGSQSKIPVMKKGNGKKQKQTPVQEEEAEAGDAEDGQNERPCHSPVVDAILNDFANLDENEASDSERPVNRSSTSTSIASAVPPSLRRSSIIPSDTPSLSGQRPRKRVSFHANVDFGQGEARGARSRSSRSADAEDEDEEEETSGGMTTDATSEVDDDHTYRPSTSRSSYPSDATGSMTVEPTDYSNSEEEKENRSPMDLNVTRRVRMIKQTCPAEFIGKDIFLPDMDHPDLRRSRRVRKRQRTPFERIYMEPSIKLVKDKNDMICAVRVRTPVQEKGKNKKAGAKRLKGAAAQRKVDAINRALDPYLANEEDNFSGNEAEPEWPRGPIGEPVGDDRRLAIDGLGEFLLKGDVEHSRSRLRNKEDTVCVCPTILRKMDGEPLFATGVVFVKPGAETTSISAPQSECFALTRGYGVPTVSVYNREDDEDVLVLETELGFGTSVIVPPGCKYYIRNESRKLATVNFSSFKIPV